MTDSPKNIIERILKENGKTKRELAKRLNISENSINRTINNPNISILKLGIIADFLEVEVNDLLPKNDSVKDPGEEYQRINPFDASNQLSINNLSEALKRNSKTIESLVQIIADNFPDKMNK